MTEPFTITTTTPTEDIPPTSFDDGNYHCETCGLVLYYAGRGRYPRFCDAHKRGGNANVKPAGGQSMKALEEALTEMYQFLGLGLTMIDPYSGMEVTGAAPKLAASWVTLAQTNPKVKKFLTKLVTGSGVGAVVMAHAMVALPILAHHDMLPAVLTKLKRT